MIIPIGPSTAAMIGAERTEISIRSTVIFFISSSISIFVTYGSFANRYVRNAVFPLAKKKTNK